MTSSHDPHLNLGTDPRVLLATSLNRFVEHGPDEPVTRRVRELFLRRTELSRTELGKSEAADVADLQDLSIGHVEALFSIYDDACFAGFLSHDLPNGARGKPSFRFSRRMTSAAGKTTRRRLDRAGCEDDPFEICEIAISIPLLFGWSATDPGPPPRVSGLVCTDRLDVFQRILEHEILHLAEMRAFGDSSCTSKRFRIVAFQLFGHLTSKHELRRTPDPALAHSGIRAGDRVRFEFRGERHEGRVNRITRRATVLVDDPDGREYADGGRYQKFYVPLHMLERID